MKTTIKVTGMMCPHCQAHVKKALEDLEGVTNVDVDLAAGTATFEGGGLDAAMAAVKAAGYEAKQA